MKNLFVLGLWYGQEYSRQNHPLERNENVHATRSAQIQNISRGACTAALQKHSPTFYFVCFQRSAGSYASKLQMQKSPCPKRKNSLGQGTDTVLGRTKCFCDATAVFSQMPHLPGKLKPVLSLPSVKSQALGPEDLWGSCSHKNYFTKQFWTLKRCREWKSTGFALVQPPQGLVCQHALKHCRSYTAASWPLSDTPSRSSCSVKLQL